MKVHNKIKAFTLSEIIIVLVLTSIVVGLAFSVLRLVQKQMLSIQENYNRNTELNKLETVLWLDFNRYAKASYSASTDELTLENHIALVKYTFTNTYVTREQDTFFIPLKSKIVFFDGIESTTNTIDAIKLTTTKSLQNQELFIFKKNDASTYMK